MFLSCFRQNRNLVEYPFCTNKCLVCFINNDIIIDVIIDFLLAFKPWYWGMVWLRCTIANVLLPLNNKLNGITNITISQQATISMVRTYASSSGVFAKVKKGMLMCWWSVCFRGSRGTTCLRRENLQIFET